MNFAALLPMIIPFITNFLKGKSGDQLGGMLQGNQQMIGNVLNAVLGKDSGLGGGAGGLAALAPMLSAQQQQKPIIVLPEGMTAVTGEGVQATTAPSSSKSRIDKVENAMNNLLDRLSSVEEEAKKLRK